MQIIAPGAPTPDIGQHGGDATVQAEGGQPFVDRPCGQVEVQLSDGDHRDPPVSGRSSWIAFSAKSNDQSCSG